MGKFCLHFVGKRLESTPNLQYDQAMNSRDFRALLKSELNRRMTTNQSYSLRAFARALKFDPSTLSKIISGQRKLGTKVQANLLTKLGFSSDQAMEFFAQIPDEDFDKMPEWYDTAILEQLTIPRFKATKKSLALVFGLNEMQVASALIRLSSLNLIRISKSGIVTDATSGQTTNVTPLSSTQAKKSLQKQFLEKAIQSIDADPIEERDMTTITCAIDPKKVTEAKARIKAFRREMAEFLTAGSNASRTYNVTIALYPLSKPIKESL